MEMVEKKQLQTKMSELKAEFGNHRKRVAEIDNLMTKLQEEKEQHLAGLIRTQGGYKALESIINVKKDNEEQHGNTSDIQG